MDDLLVLFGPLLLFLASFLALSFLFWATMRSVELIDAALGVFFNGGFLVLAALGAIGFAAAYGLPVDYQPWSGLLAIIYGSTAVLALLLPVVLFMVGIYESIHYVESRLEWMGSNGKWPPPEWTRK